MEQIQNNEVAMTGHLPARYIVRTNQWVYMNLGCAKKIAGGIIAFNVASIEFISQMKLISNFNSFTPKW